MCHHLYAEYILHIECLAWTRHGGWLSPGKPHAFCSIVGTTYGRGYFGSIYPKEKLRLRNVNDPPNFHIRGGLQPRVPSRGPFLLSSLIR